MQLILPDEEATAILAQKISGIIRPGQTIGLSGELGAGKTTFTRYFVRQLGIMVPVSSPTFVLQHEYSAAGALTVEHWDLYREHSLPEELLEPAGVNEIRLIEWADRFPEFAARLDGFIKFEFMNGSALGQRKIDTNLL